MHILMASPKQYQVKDAWIFEGKVALVMLGSGFQEKKVWVASS